MTNFTMKDIYHKLSLIGLKKKKVNECMPDWWLEHCTEITKTEAGIQETLWHIANSFSIDFGSLIESFSEKDKKPKFIFGNHLFKHSQNLNETELQPAVSVAMFIAKNTMSVYEKPLADLNGLTALSIREKLLQNAKWLDFETLLSYTWSLGIPVIFSSNIPPKKMDGLALKIQDRPVIVLTKGRTHGYLVFDLAHELGHIVLGHLNQKKIIVDEKISANDIETELFEQQADEFALELLTGYKGIIYPTKKYSPKGLFQLALRKSSEGKIDPLHFVLNYGHSSGQFSLANQVLGDLVKQLGLENTDQQIAYEYYLSNIDLNNFDDEEVILNIIGG